MNRLLAAHVDALESLPGADLTGRAFPASVSLTSKISTAVAEYWQKSSTFPKAVFPDTVLYFSGKSGNIRGLLKREPESYDSYISHFQTIRESIRDDSILGHEGRGNLAVKCTDVVLQDPLDSLRGACHKSAVPCLQKADVVFKGVTFADYLAFPDDAFRCRMDSLRREISLLCNTIPRHPNIMPPPLRLVVHSSPEGLGSGKVVGILYEWYKNGSVAALIERSLESGSRIPPSWKAKWCFQLADALYHVHHKGRSWHQDLKPPNILLDDECNVVIIDWEQGIGGAITFISASEVDGSFDLEVKSSGSSANDSLPELVYIPYQGPPRINNIIGIPQWDVFPQWHELSPRAVEAADVFSLGSTMFLLLEEIGLERQPGLGDYSRTRRLWTDKSADIPQEWKDNVTACTRQDANDRLTLTEVRAFWGNEWRRQSMAVSDRAGGPA